MVFAIVWVAKLNLQLFLMQLPGGFYYAISSHTHSKVVNMQKSVATLCTFLWEQWVSTRMNHTYSLMLYTPSKALRDFQQNFMSFSDAPQWRPWTRSGQAMVYISAWRGLTALGHLFLWQS